MDRMVIRGIPRRDRGVSPAEARASFYEAVQGSRLDMADYDNNPARRTGWEAALEQENASA